MRASVRTVISSKHPALLELIDNTPPAQIADRWPYPLAAEGGPGLTENAGDYPDNLNL